MYEMLEKCQVVLGQATGVAFTVEELLGSGGQGEVYRASVGDKSVALKWYFPHTLKEDERLPKRLEMAIESEAPSEKFLWPLALVSASGFAGFGYVMPLREARYRSLFDLMGRRIEPTFRALSTSGFELAHSYLQLHGKGLCYRDISLGNAFLDPITGEILICDNDNVDVNGHPGGPVGTPRFMAPEIVRREAEPTTNTDLFSLAVLLFHMFIMHHPLEGEKELGIHCLDLPAMTKLFGTEPVFIFDPDDDSNRPLRGYHDNALEFWPIYPQFLRGLFTKAFTDGIHDPNGGRVRESEWRAAIVRLRDSIFYCPHCGLENFCDVEALKRSGTDPGSCWSCGRALRLPPRIRIGESVIMLNHDAELFPHHTGDEMYDFSQPTATVTQHPKDPRIWGLKNLSDEKWVTTASDGTMRDVEPGRNVRLARDTTINFGGKVGEIRD